MLELYRPPESLFCDEVEETLVELVLAHRVTVVDEAVPHKGPDLPYVKMGRAVYTSETEIQDLLDELAYDLKQDREFQSDACYINPEEGTVC